MSGIEQCSKDTAKSMQCLLLHCSVVLLLFVANFTCLVQVSGSSAITIAVKFSGCVVTVEQSCFILYGHNVAAWHSLREFSQNFLEFGVSNCNALRRSWQMCNNACVVAPCQLLRF